MVLIYDLKQLNLTENKTYTNSKSEKGDGYIDTQDAKYICPIVGIEMNGMYRFSFLWSCGCVLSERALKEIKGEACHKCGKAYKETDIVPLNGSEEEVEVLRSKLEEKRLQQKLEKKAKKSKKEKCETVTSATEDGPSTSKQSKLDTSSTASSAGSQKSGDSKLTNGVKDSKKLTNGSTIRSLSDKYTVPNGGSVQKDPKASSAYKSLFTTSEKAKNQMKGHWVTSNPYWN
ncbi:Protein RTF2 [Mactra antiquata]